MIEQDLAVRSKRRRLTPLDANPRDKRLAHDVHLTLTIPEREELKKRAAAERRSLSNYVARLVVGELDTQATQARRPRSRTLP